MPRFPMSLSPAVLSVTVAVALAAALGACQQRAANPPVAAAAPAPAAPVALPTGGGCGPEIARTQAIVASDVATGNLNKPVGERFDADLSRASATCAAGRSGEALAELSAAKTRYGYR